MKNYIYILIVFLILPFTVMAQDSDEVTQDTIVKEKLERAAFESSYIIENPTNVVLNKNAMEIQMNHRFGIIDNWNDLGGIWGAANIRLGVAYGVHERVTLGFGTTKNRRYQDFSAKVAILRQTRSNTMPISLTYFGNMAYDAREQTSTNAPPINYHQDRLSYFHQLIVVRRFSPNFSLQFAPSLSHYNAVYDGMSNTRISVAFGGRYKISPNTSILFDYSQPLTQFDTDKDPGVAIGANPRFTNHPGMSLGFEFGTSGHAFQLFITNYSGIVPQDNYVWNKNDFFDGKFMLGFNITRIYNF
ncbi:DUF5777 family beta-barrel protein [Lutimonas vermicola]|uniref:DUF5777 family beta-barrel protein n=1 Tax=Lutimonas vermicola TaxID=414288 RepID=A0ABU9KYE1_9FLAO